ncbi:SDR family oxidoreductase [Nocardia vinacea]|uniref:SDR family oxidoreductase n=1 Tax=Nocardia vinacea TaxID=96468 RepID=UPI003441FF08
MMYLSLSGRVVAITGAARGIGRTLAKALLARGARVAIADIDADTLARTAKEISANFHQPVDVTDPASFRLFLLETEKQLGPLDIMINNAGIMPTGPLLEESDTVTRRILEINTFGCMTGTKLALALMVPRGRGHIVNLASTMGEASVPGLVSYNASKAAVIRFSDAARLEFRSSGVRFSTVLPGAVNTELATGIKGPKGIRNIEPADVAAAVVDALESGKSHPRIYVPRTFGILLNLQRVLPLAVAEAVNRLMGAESAVLRDSDLASRRAYDDRVGRS